MAHIPGQGSGFAMLAYDWRDLTPAQITKLNWPLYAEPKYDGVRIIAKLDGAGKVKFLTRTKKEITSLVHLEGPIREFLSVDSMIDGDLTLDGEIMGPWDFDTISGLVRQHSATELHKSLWYCVFDVPSRYQYNWLYRKRWLEDRQHVNSAFHIRIPIHVKLHDEMDVYSCYAHMRQHGHEGIMIKDPHEYYYPKRHRAWLKMKEVDSLDAPICGVVEGTGKYVGMMGLIQVRLESGEIVGVGTGFTDQDRAWFWDTWHNKKEALEGKMVEVAYQQRTPGGSLRIPRFVRLRPDLDT